MPFVPRRTSLPDYSLRSRDELLLNPGDNSKPVPIPRQSLTLKQRTDKNTYRATTHACSRAAECLINQPTFDHQYPAPLE